MNTGNFDSQESRQGVNEEEALKTSDTPSLNSLQSELNSVLMKLLKGYTELNELTSLTNFVDKSLEIRIKVSKEHKK